jgi:UDP-N-acetylglucosamine acyltransferase
MSIHATAIIDKNAQIAESAEIGPYCIIHEGAVIGEGARLLSNVIIEGDTEIGPGTTVYPFASIGLPPQDLKYKKEKTGVKIGSNNIIREYVTVHRGSVGGAGYTIVGDENFIMAYSHIAHDCKLGSKIIMANVATLAGHIEVQDHAVLGGLIAVHQFVRIGAYAMVGGMSGIAQDVPPYTMAMGPRACLYGLNLIGLRRHGFSQETINELSKAYRMLFRSKNTIKEAIKRVQEEIPYTDEIKALIEFVKASRRGICKAGKVELESV